MDEDLDMLVSFPGVHTIQDDKESVKKSYEGMVFIESVIINVHLEPSTRGIYKLQLKSPSKLLGDILVKVNEQKHKHPVTMLHEFEKLAKESMKYIRHYEPIPADIYMKVLQEYQEFVKFFFNLSEVKLSNDLSLITIVYPDKKLRQHSVSIKVDYTTSADSPNLFGYNDCGLPVMIKDKSNSLVCLFQKFIGAIETYDEFFCTLAEVDRCCWVVHPETPKSADTHRRIVIAESVSAVINFQPNDPLTLPQIKVIGPPAKEQRMTEEIMSNFDNWDDTGDIVDELLKLFNMDDFPKRPENVIDRDEADEWGVPRCSICLCLRNENGNLVEIFCPNDPCPQCFHTECFHKWSQRNLHENPNNSHGKCPHCNVIVNYNT